MKLNKCESIALVVGYVSVERSTSMNEIHKYASVILETDEEIQL